jgi:hypothetical protein
VGHLTKLVQDSAQKDVEMAMIAAQALHNLQKLPGSNWSKD